jgi:hypothetical protein
MNQAAENLAFEERWRTRAIVCAVLGALVPLGGFFVRAVAVKNIPDVSIDQLIHIEHHRSGLLFSGVLIGLGAFAEAGALYYLYRAVKGRRPALPVFAQYAIFIGAIGTFVSTVAVAIALGSAAHNWLHDNPLMINDISARDALRGTGLQVLQAVGLVGQLSLGFAFVVISLNAMRIGLLTRFVGVIGIVSGVFLVIPLLSPLPIVQAFFLLALAALFAKRWPSGLPDAWTSGEARPWPSQQDLREARKQVKGEDERRDGSESEVVEAAGVGAAGNGDLTPHPSSKKRKRKRKR